MNRCYFISVTATDPVLRGEGSKAVLTWRGAVHERTYNQQSADWEDSTTFLDFVLFGNRAQSVADFLHKGSRCTLECRAKVSTWEAEDGSKRSRTEFQVLDITVHRDAN